MRDRLEPLPSGAVTLGGHLGHKLNQCITNRVLSQDVDKLVKPFRERTESTLKEWRGEYWGKWLTSAVLGYQYRTMAEQKTQIDEAVRKLIETQLPDGYLGTHAKEHRLETWDIWCRKYVLIGLIAAFDLTGDKTALEAAKRNADSIIAGLRERKLRLLETGFPVLQGLDSSSILEPIVLLYQRTGENRYLKFARSIVEQWSEPSKYAPDGLRLIEKALADAPPLTNHAYCIMSAFEGVCELYRATGDKRFLDAAVRFAQAVRRYELTVIGSVSYKEVFYRGAARQTEPLDEQQETCASVTWIKLCAQLLRLTGDPVWADEMEKSLYNALLGAMTPRGEWWSYFSPLKGARAVSHIQHDGDVGLSCCVANGPRGLLLTPRWAVMMSETGPVINLYAAGTTRIQMRDGSDVKIVQDTVYPVSGQVRLILVPSRPSRFALSLRIPAWSRRTFLSVNGLPVPCAPGTYAKLNREWASGDQVTLQLDMRGRSVRAPSGDLAVLRGPIVLALDSRLSPRQDTIVRMATDADGYVDLMPSPSKPANIMMAFDVPFLVPPSHSIMSPKIKVAMCDFSSAGNSWRERDRYQVWLPQPMDMNKIYVDLPWQYMHGEFYRTHKFPSLEYDYE